MKIHPQIIVLDFDRTLADVDALMGHFYQTAHYYGIKTQAIIEARKSVENDGGSFDPYIYVQKSLGKDVKRFNQLFITTSPDLLFPDARIFLNNLYRQTIPYIVLTYGVNPDWQKLKVEASGYKGPCIVLDHTEKGRVISEWQINSDFYTVPLHDNSKITSESILLIDDKVIAFKGMSEASKGFLIQRKEQLLPNQQGELPRTIEIIKSFDELSISNGVIVHLKK